MARVPCGLETRALDHPEKNKIPEMGFQAGSDPGTSGDRGSPGLWEAGLAKGLQHLNRWGTFSGRVKQPVGKGEPQHIIYFPTP